MEDKLLDDIISEAIKDVTALKAKSSGFNILNKEMMEAGKIDGANLQGSKRMRGEHSWTAGFIFIGFVERADVCCVAENPVACAQNSSALYCGKNNPTAVLQNEKKEVKKTVGKGWFDMEVLF
jgi:hypothetical protein